MIPTKPQEPVLPYRRVPPLVRPGLTLPCGCRVEQHGTHGITIKYCPRHETFVFSPRHDGTDVFYFVAEEEKL